MSDRLSASSRIEIGEGAIELECLPYSVQHADEGVCLLIRMGPHRILLDCGMSDISPLVKGLTKPARRGSFAPTSRFSSN